MLIDLPYVPNTIFNLFAKICTAVLLEPATTIDSPLDFFKESKAKSATCCACLESVVAAAVLTPNLFNK